MTRLSVNINKFATLRNSRGGNNPDVVQAALNAEKFGAQGITVHPRPDERHIKYADVYALKEMISTEFNIEGNPVEDRFRELVLFVHPHQVTLVPDSRDTLTSNKGWDCIRDGKRLSEYVNIFKKEGLRVSVFLDPDTEQVEAALQTGTDRIELYTEAYAHGFLHDKSSAIKPYIKAAEKAMELGLGLNAGHDLDLNNLRYFKENIPGLLEVSIGHALVCDALYLGLEETIRRYLKELA